MWWERGTLLKQYGNINYTYDAQGKLYKKKANGRTTINYYDENKLIAQKVGGKIIRYFYDIEGVCGFKIGTGQKYMYGKDAQGNVVSLYHDYTIVAKYVYDAWGNCKVLDYNGNEITAWDNPAILNPYRWKSQYYDTDSGLYWIGDRWYDPERGRYISSASPETLISNAAIIYALNLYALTTTNPLAVIFAAYTIFPSLDFYYDGAKTWWERWGNIILLGIGIIASIVACIFSGPCGIAVSMATVGATLAKIAVATIIGAAISLVVGGAVAGLQSAITGHNFFEGFSEYVCENAVDELVTSFAFTAVTFAISNVIGHFQCFKEGTLVETEEGLKPIEDIQVGDMVLAYDEETGKQAFKPVLHLFRNKSCDWTGVTVNGTEIISTTGHKYYLPKKKEWVAAAELKKGTKVLLSNGTCGIITKVRSIHYDEPQTTYNFEVADFHTYYVGTGVLVHNMGNGPCKYYRGSNRGEGNERIFEPRQRDIDTKNGVVTQENGISVNTDPNHPTVTNFKHVYELTTADLPDGLTIKLDPKIGNPGHCIIVPESKSLLTTADFINYSKRIKSKKIR